jgi:hypothetical protein
MPLPLTAINYMHPDVLLWRACLWRFTLTATASREAWHATYPVIVRHTEVDGVHCGDVMIPLPASIVYDTFARGIPYSLLSSLMPVPPSFGLPPFTLPDPSDPHARPFAHATYAPPTAADATYPDTPIPLPQD